MYKKWKKILPFVFLLSTIQAATQVNWDKIELAGAEAKILGSAGIEQNRLLIIQTFETKEGKISVYMPPLSSGVMISGTVYLEPNGKTIKDSSQNLLALQSHHLSMGDAVIPVQRGSFRLQLPTDPGSGMISLQLNNSEGQLIKSEQLPLTKAPGQSSGFTFPPYMVSGDQAIVTGSFDGDITNTSVKINGEKAELLAESSTRLFLKTTSSYTGYVIVECAENGTTNISKTNVLKLYITVDNPDLRRGQQTRLHIKISGMEGLKESVPVTINNTSSSVITLEGGNTQQINVVPESDAPSGVLETTRNIQSLKNGNFTVNVIIIPFTTTLR